MTPILCLAAIAVRFGIWPGVVSAQLAEPLPKLNYESTGDFFELPVCEHLLEPAGVRREFQGGYVRV
jgi:hypothetical protein